MSKKSPSAPCPDGDPSRDSLGVKRGQLSQYEVDFEADSPAGRELRRRQRRRAGFVGAVWVVVFVCFAALGVAAWNESNHNPRFALKEIIVHTDGQLSAERLGRELGLAHGQNTLWLNLGALGRKIESLPQVISASVRRDYEGHVELEVVQREPVAWLECHRLGLFSKASGQGCLLDVEGVAFPCEVLLKPYLSLPVIRYEELSQVLPGRPVRDVQVVAALGLLASLREREEAGLAPQALKVEVPARYRLLVSFAGGMEVSFNPDELPPQLKRFDRVMLQARQDSWQIASLDLIPSVNVPIRFREEPNWGRKQ
jgi:cell division septal protein FtsQ